ncbi:MAG: internal scaffolding protein [Microvirus sp.]|nr:MAG: internal scaffolding protein [Microvirus sp.]
MYSSSDVRNPFLYDRDEASVSSGLSCADLSLAVQDQRDEVDINTIVRRFGLTGELPSDVRAPVYGDFTVVNDYQTALNAVLSAQAAFMEMPASVRERFGNDPQAFVEFCSDPVNGVEARKLGLLVPEAPEALPVAVRVIPDPVVDA